MWFLNGLNSNIYLDGSTTSVKKLAEYKNRFAFMNVFAQLVNEALERYHIKNLPPTVSHRVVLESLLWYGAVCFFKKEGSILALPAMPTGNFTLYGDPVKAIVHGRNGYTEEIPLHIPNGESPEVRMGVDGETVPEDGKGVYIRENRMGYPFINEVIDAADKISDTLRTLDEIKMHLKCPIAMAGPASAKNTAIATYNKINNNEELIYLSTGAHRAQDIQIIDIKATAEDTRGATELIEWYFHQFRQKEGLKSPSTVDKKAQINNDELHQDDEISEFKQNTTSTYLQEQLGFANEKMGMNLELVEAVEEDDTEGEENADNDERNKDIPEVAD